ncbi:unnamed protein product, partial [Darwinula stevensoni]
DERNQALDTSVEVVERWTDAYLKWDPTDYGGIEEIIVPYASIWTPDIVLLNSAATNYEERLLRTNAIVSWTGKVTLLTGAMFRSVCDVDVSYFPFDTQNCSMRFGSWCQDVTKIQMESDYNATLELGTYIESQEFSLESYKAEKILNSDPCCPNPFDNVNYVILMKRRTFFFFVSYVLPMVIINILALLAFLIPSESGAKVTLGISAMLTAIVFLMTIRDILPPSENMPLLGKYYCASICLVSLEVALCVFTVSIHHLKDIRLSLRIQNACRLLAKLTCMKEPRFHNVILACESKRGKNEFSDGIRATSHFGGRLKSSRRHAWKGPFKPMSKEPMSSARDLRSMNPFID